MRKPLPREGFTKPGPGEHDIPDPTTDVEGHALLDQARLPIDQAAGAPGTDSFLGDPTSTKGDYQDDRGPDAL